MSKLTSVYGNFPFPPDKKKPLHIRKDTLPNFLYPEDQPHSGDLNYFYVSTDKITVATWQLGPGGTFEQPSLHPGDEVYYVLEGELTELNPVTGEFMQAKKGEALLIPKGGRHKSWNFTQNILHCLAIIAPKIWDEKGVPYFDPDKMKMYKGKNNDSYKVSSPIPQWYLHGTTDDIGRWPAPGQKCREEPIHFYVITEEKKLINVHGTKYPMLIKFFVSNDVLHIGEFILPAGGIGSRASEPDSHKGDCLLYIQKGPITVFLPDTSEAFNIQNEDAMLIPEGIKYQLINYTSDLVKAIFCIGPGL